MRAENTSAQTPVQELFGKYYMGNFPHKYGSYKTKTKYWLSAFDKQSKQSSIVL